MDIWLRIFLVGGGALFIYAGVMLIALGFTLK